MLVKEFIVNLSADCSIKGTQEYIKVFERGKLVKFSPSIIKVYLGRNKLVKSDRVLSIDMIENEITAGQVKQWPVKGLYFGKLCVKYIVMNMIGVATWAHTNHSFSITLALAKLIFHVGTKSKENFGEYDFNKTMCFS